MAEHMIRVVGTAFGAFPPGTPTLLVSGFDPDAKAGFGAISMTNDPDLALRFPSVGEATEFYRRQSKTRPFRPDGEPNRPMTAFSIEVLLAAF